MDDHERAMLAYVTLAALSQQRQQRLGRDKFLVLAGAAACRAGWPEVAEQCRALIVAHNPAHLVGKFSRFAEAMRHSDFQALLKQMNRFCPYERAEHLLNQLDLEPGFCSQPYSAGEAGKRALHLLRTGWDPGS